MATQGVEFSASELGNLAVSTGGRFEAYPEEGDLHGVPTIVFEEAVRLVFPFQGTIRIEAPGKKPLDLSESFVRRRESGFDIVKPYPGEAPRIVHVTSGADIVRQLPG